MTLNDSIITIIKQKSQLLFDKTGDYDLLASLIFKETGRTIGVTTLKRLFNYINDSRKANEYTLNTIAIYLGYNDWNNLCREVNVNSIWGYDNQSVYIHTLEVGKHIEISYLNRKVCFIVVQQNGKNVLQVEESVNSSLQIGDICDIYKICKGNILEAEHIYRGDNIGNYKTQGEISSIKIY